MHMSALIAALTECEYAAHANLRREFSWLIIVCLTYYKEIANATKASERDKIRECV